MITACMLVVRAEAVVVHERCVRLRLGLIGVCLGLLAVRETGVSRHQGGPIEGPPYITALSY